MAKLYFRYGTVGSAKTLNLLAVAHNYRQQNKNVLLLKPVVDTRFGKSYIKSRAGLKMEADYLLSPQTLFSLNGQPLRDATCYEKDIINLDHHKNTKCLIVDEVQFLTAALIEQLHQITILADIPVIAYGLKTNFRGEFFQGSKRIMELADSIEEVKSTCYYCNRKATFNLKFKNAIPTFDGPEVELGAEETYKPVCKYCYDEKRKNKLARDPY